MEPCLACGLPVHPIAGHCKHCRADLVALRASAAREARRRAAEAVPRPPLRAPTPLPVPVAAPPSAPAPAVAAASRRRRWPIVAAVVVVLAAGVGGGVFAQRLYASAHADEPEVRDVEVRDHGSWLKRPRAQVDPAPTPDADADIYADPDPLSPFRRPGGSRPPQAGAAPRVDQFGQALAGVLCEKLATCGLLDDMGAGMCSMMADALDDPLTAERVRRGECRYDQNAATQCLDALSGLRCDAALDPGELLAMADSMGACSHALRCD